MLVSQCALPMSTESAPRWPGRSRGLDHTNLTAGVEEGPGSPFKRVESPQGAPRRRAHNFVLTPNSGLSEDQGSSARTCVCACMHVLRPATFSRMYTWCSILPSPSTRMPRMRWMVGMTSGASRSIICLRQFGEWAVRSISLEGDVRAWASESGVGPPVHDGSPPEPMWWPASAERIDVLASDSVAKAALQASWRRAGGGRGPGLSGGMSCGGERRQASPSYRSGPPTMRRSLRSALGAGRFLARSIAGTAQTAWATRLEVLRLGSRSCSPWRQKVRCSAFGSLDIGKRRTWPGSAAELAD